jgi:hypothetical protein
MSAIMTALPMLSGLSEPDVHGFATMWRLSNHMRSSPRSESEEQKWLATESIRRGDEQHGSPSSAADALERIEIAQDVRDRIAERLWTGGSLIISDEPLSGETGAVGTDLTVKVR